ncbi:hypothetical protein B0O99DRAFT_735775 [Bisporella sp. PMI_857]|nr:hypothetical protein B0O99DRAFT_735775 [Bisporella sp. PMI_857]
MPHQQREVIDLTEDSEEEKQSPSAAVTSKDVVKRSAAVAFQEEKPKPSHCQTLIRPSELALPFRILHELLKRMQKIIEDALFYFTKRWDPELLHRLGWETPEQGELTVGSWWNTLQKLTVSQHAVDFGGVNARILYSRTTQIRHAAVHRLPVLNSRLRQELFPTALRFLRGLKDSARWQQIQDLQNAFEGGQNGLPNLVLLQELLGIEAEGSLRQNQRAHPKEIPDDGRNGGPAVKRARIKANIDFIDLIQVSSEEPQDHNNDRDGEVSHKLY